MNPIIVIILAYLIGGWLVLVLGGLFLHVYVDFLYYLRNHHDINYTLNDGQEYRDIDISVRTLLIIYYSPIIIPIKGIIRGLKYFKQRCLKSKEEQGERYGYGSI